jgi:hypothetical protein
MEMRRTEAEDEQIKRTSWYCLSAQVEHSQSLQQKRSLSEEPQEVEAGLRMQWPQTATKRVMSVGVKNTIHDRRRHAHNRNFGRLCVLAFRPPDSKDRLSC